MYRVILFRMVVSFLLVEVFVFPFEAAGTGRVGEEDISVPILHFPLLCLCLEFDGGESLDGERSQFTEWDGFGVETGNYSARCNDEDVHDPNRCCVLCFERW